MTVIDLMPKGVEAIKLWPVFMALRHVWGFRWMHKHCGALGYWQCEGCGKDIEKACAENEARQ